jgi:hypothetical protein
MTRILFAACCAGFVFGLIGCASTNTATPLTQKEADDATCEAAGYAFATYQYNECLRNLRAQRSEDPGPDGGER